MIKRRFQFGLAALAACCALTTSVLRAQNTNTAAGGDVDRMVREGMVAALESRFSGAGTLEQLQQLALAQANKAARVRDDAARQAEFEDAERRYQAWIEAVESEADAERVVRVINAATARHALASMILSTWVAADLDAFELTGGRRGESQRLYERLLKARDLYERARDALKPTYNEIAAGGPRTEEKYLVLGVYGAIPQILLDIDFNLAWTNLYLAMVNPRSGEVRKAGLRSAERSFQDLVDSGRGDETAARCRLGLAMALREQGRCDEARPEFDEALRGAKGALAAQVRYERARSEINAKRFEEARIVLRPLVEKNPDRLSAGDRPARFYINLAHLWDANSYLEQAGALEAAAAESATTRDALLKRAQSVRETGLWKMNALTERGGGWPALVQLYVADVIDESADTHLRSPASLLYSARRLSLTEDHQAAIALLREAAGRKDQESQYLVEVLFELGVCYYRNGANREAAEAFDRVAREFKSHAKASRAVTYAYQLWAGIADDSKRPEDYRRLADVILNLLQSFPEHEKREEASWWLPVALQSAGEFEAALESYGGVSKDSPRYDEARFRKAICARLAFDQQRGTLAPSTLQSRANRVAEELEEYANGEHQAGASERAAKALVGAAEVYGSSGISQYQRALETLDDFERRFPNSQEIGRVLAVRISAHRGLEQFEQAARVLERFLREVSPENAGGTLGEIARGMQEEIDRLERAGDVAAAREMAVSAIPIFEQLESWILADAARAKYVIAVRYGLARVRLLAGEHDSAAALARGLLTDDPRNGDYQRLLALALTAGVDDDASADNIAAARDAWGRMLRDESLRTTAPERYWEARYNYLALLLREGRAAEVDSAIEQERVWRPALGGEHWSTKLGELQEAARRASNRASDPSIPQSTQPPAP